LAGGARKNGKPGEHRRKSARRAMPARLNFISSVPGKLFPAILGRVANPVEPFGLVAVQDGLPLAFLCGVRQGLGQMAHLFKPLAAGCAD
jgi:hypothetical protein